MAQITPTLQTIIETIRVIGQQEAEMQILRQQLNHEITFNLKDTYLAIAGDQNIVSFKKLSSFLQTKQSTTGSLQKLIKWNSHNNSLNLSFAQFSALLINKQDRLLAKMTLQRQAMGAIPNFVLELIKKIMTMELFIHEHISKYYLEDQEELTFWIKRVTDDEGDLDIWELRRFVSQSQNEEEEEGQLFVRYLKTTGNLTAERLRYLWLGDNHQQFQPNLDSTIKFNKLSTMITCPTSPKTLISCKSLKQISVRPQFYDCLNRPLMTEQNDLRNKKSIEKHVHRIDFHHNIKKIVKIKQTNFKHQLSIGKVLEKIKEIVDIELKTQQLRVDLCMCTDFYPILFFDTIPKQKSGGVLASNFKDYLEQFGYHLDLTHVYFLFRRYSKQLGKINFNGFCSIFDVSDQEYNLIEKNRFVQSLTDINLGTKRLFFQLVVIAAKNQQQINEIKTKLLRECEDFNGTINYMFKECQQGINEEILKNLFSKHLKVRLRRKQMKILWKKLNLNLKNDDFIKKEHLLSQLIPSTTVKKSKQS